MAASSTSATSLDAMEMLDIGKTCAAQHCHVHDFLPLSCPCCSQPFCSDHWKPQSHACAKAEGDEQGNIVHLPTCPLCHKTISLRLGQDPNEPMDQHLTSECAMLRPPGQPKQKRVKPNNECRAGKCRTKMITPIQCESCRQSFCASHRFPQDHDCAQSQSRAKSTATRSAAVSSAGLAALARVRASATKAVVRQQKAFQPSQAQSQRVVINLDDSSDENDEFDQQQPTNPLLNKSPRLPSTSSNNNSPHSSPNLPHASPNPSTSSEVEIISDVRGKAAAKKSTSFIPTAQDRRAKAERASQLKSLHNRAQKGLLSEREKVQYATLQAKQAQEGRLGGKGGGECNIV